MTLDDFFTLNEMNNGLTAPSRVRELMVVMQKERDCTVKSAADSARQRSAVASVISATENKDCLDLFLQLDGLQYVSNWLKDAQSSSIDTNDGFLEEYITHLFQALEKLSVSYEEKIAFEIQTVVKNFLNHNSRQVQDKARALLESWKTKGDIDACSLDVNKTRALTDVEANNTGCSETSVNNNEHEITTDDKVLSTSFNGVSHDQIETAHESNRISGPMSVDERPFDHQVSSPSSSKPTVGPAHSHSVSNNDGFDPSRPASSRQDNLIACTDFHGLGSNQSEDGTEPRPRINSSEDSDGKDDGACASDANQYRGLNDFIPKGGGDSNCRTLPETAGTISWGNFLSGISNFMKTNDLADNHTLAKKQTMDREESDWANKRPEIEIDYGIMDPLEVARQVAMEVEREIVDYREQSCSSTEKSPGRINSSLQAKSSESASGKISDLPMDEADGSSSSNKSVTSSENPNTNDTQDGATSQVTEAAQEAIQEEKSPRNFIDLNQKVISEDCDTLPSNQLSYVVSVVSASRATPSTSKPPDGPLEFEGNLGWKGSALTSAFRPASPRRGPDEEQQRCGLEFDLNVSESIGESSVDANSKKSGLLELDLNRTSEDGGGPLLDWRIGSFYPQPSIVQSARVIDLNDSPSFANVSSNDSSYLINKASQNFCDSAITIMGKRVEVEKDFSASRTMPMQTGRDSEVTFDYNLGRMGNSIGIEPTAPPYTHSPVYGYSNMDSGHPTAYSGPLYGLTHHSIPYMVDSRGAQVVPQIMVPASGLPSAFPQPPFLLNGPTMHHPNGVGPSRNNFDLNSRMLVENGNRDPSGLGLFLNSTHVRPVDGPNSQSTMGSSVGGKRKEADNGYNIDHFYPIKHFMPHWKQS